MSNAFDKASLVMLPHAYEDGKLYSLKPTDRSGDFTFSRGSDTATRVGEDGYIKKETSNLLLQSNQFDTTWTTTNSSVTSGQSGYDGSNDAWLLDKSGNTGRIKQDINSSGVNAFSIYAKANTSSWVRLLINGAALAYFDLSTGSVGTTGVNGFIDAKIDLAGNGWYKCSLIGVGSSTIVNIVVADADGAASGTSGSIYIQDAQLNQGLVAQDYLETTTAPVYGGLTDNMPRLDYTDATCPSLLLEPSRTNLLTQSEYYGDLAPTRITLTSNYGISPEGVQNAAAIFNTTENGRHNLNGSYFAVTSGTSYVNSVFAKAGTITKMKLRMFSGGGTDIGFNDGDFDLTNGTATGTGAEIESYGNGWYRCYVVDSPTSSVSNARFNIELLDASGGVSYVGSVTDYIEIFGSQVEAGTYPTSYIPTYGSSQTRLRDSTFASVTNTTSRTYFLDGKRLANKDISNTSPVYDPNDNLKIAFWSNNRLRFRFGGSVNQYYTLIGDDFKIALSYNGTDSKIFVNGQYWTTQTSFDLGNVSVLTINGNESISYNQLLLFPTALSDSECISLTTL